jgi:type IX secretion system PorP/SprF family membrane protein
MKKVLFTFILGAVSLMSSAQQDRHFSMFFANPVLLNPGAAGHGNGSLQAFTSFRTQWFTASNTAFRSIAAGIDGKMMERSLSNGFIGTGVNFVNDVSGDSKYTLNVVSVPINYSIQLNETSYLSVGLQPGIYAQRINPEALYFDNQWTGAGFNTDFSSGENLGTFSVSRFDLGAGVYYKSTKSEKYNYQVGLSGFHLTGQKIGVLNLSEKLYRNFTAYGKIDIGNSSSNLTMSPAVFALIQGPNKELTFGSNFDYIIKPSSIYTGYFDGMSLGFGLYFRTSDAFISNIVYRAGGLTLGVSYDVNVSPLSAATKGVGALEIFLKFAPKLKAKFGSPRIH